MGDWDEAEQMNYREMNRVVAALCGLIGFGVITMIALTTLETVTPQPDLTFYFQ